jgi:hypothetical protein
MIFLSMIYIVLHVSLKKFTLFHSDKRYLEFSTNNKILYQKIIVSYFV